MAGGSVDGVVGVGRRGGGASPASRGARRDYAELLVALTLVAGMSGVLFGYDASSINTALKPMADHFELSALAEGIVVSVLLLGAFLGALASSACADRFGRRGTILVSNALFVVGLLMSSYVAFHVGVVVAGRLVIGSAIGVTSAVTPLFIAEVAPARHRGGLVMAYQLSITAGILLALGVGAALTPSRNWRLMIFLAVVPSALQALGLILFVPESPRWLFLRGRVDEARAVLCRIRETDEEAEAEVADMEALSRHEKLTWSQVLADERFPRAMLAGAGVAALSALGGVNAVMYYSTKMFEIAGLDSPVLSSLAVGVTNFLASIVSLWVVNNFPRRKLLFIGMSGQVLGMSLAATSLLASDNRTAGAVMVLGVLFFVVNFAYSSGPLTWVVISEVFPISLRGTGCAAATSVNWLSNLAVALAYPPGVEDDDESTERRNVGFSLYAFALVSLLGLTFVWAFVPEMHLMSLEDIEQRHTGEVAARAAQDGSLAKAADAPTRFEGLADGPPATTLAGT